MQRSAATKVYQDFVPPTEIVEEPQCNTLLVYLPGELPSSDYPTKAIHLLYVLLLHFLELERLELKLYPIYNWSKGVLVVHSSLGILKYKMITNVT